MSNVVPLVGKRLGHYLVLEKLGSGGMGDVYVAEDTKLERRVALKFLRAEVAESRDSLARFQREAKAAAALNHPNIVHLYSVEDVDGQSFITMELVQGRSLHELLADEAPLPLPLTFSIAAQIAEGLSCAHAAGILHRDLKPSNVMITGDDRAKILDFGVATFFKPTASSERSTANREATTTGMTLGTVGYMSPEQALGKTLDASTDLFALGVVLFEMATGKAPFAGDTPAAVFDRLLNRRHTPPRELNPDVPGSLEAVIDKALEKDPEGRYRSASDFLRDLKQVNPTGNQVNATANVTEPRRPPSIVVLPFVDMSADKDQEYFCHGITEEIINALTRVRGMRVISRTSAFAFQGKDLEVTDIGRRLKVDTALEGSVRKAGNRVRVTAQLVSTEDGYQLWSKRFDRELADVFAIQDEIAASIVSELRIGLGGEAAGQRASLDIAALGSLERFVTAHDAYLKGIYARNKWTAESVQRAITDFREAIAHDSRFAPAYAALAETHMWLYSSLGILPASDTVPEARWAVAKALELDPTLSDAHKVRALIAMNHDWDQRGAEEALTRALQLGPGSATAHFWNAWRLALLERRHDQALIELEEAERLDPLDLQLKTQIGYVHYFHHDFDRAIAQFEKVLSLEPSFAFAHYALGDISTQSGHYDRGIAEFTRAIELGGRSPNHIGALGYAYGRSGNQVRATECLAELTTRARDEYVSAMWIALVHLGLADRDRVFECLNRAFEQRDGSLILITAALEFDPVRDDPRFTLLLERMGLGYLASPQA